MGINVIGENARLWITERDSNNGGKWNEYSVGVSSKFDDKWVNDYQKVMFAKSIDLTGVQNGAKFDFKGFMSIKKPWTNKDGKTVKEKIIVITEATFEETTGFSEVNEPLPF